MVDDGSCCRGQPGVARPMQEPCVAESHMALHNSPTQEGHNPTEDAAFATGIDNTVSTFGDYILFEKGQIQKFYSSIDLPILIVDSGMPKNTMDQVMKVRRLYEKHKAICNQLLEAIDTIVADFVEILRTGKDLEKLEDLVNMNHGLLVALSVSNQELDAIVGVCQKNGFACKLTGGGGGGCCFVLLKNEVQYEQLIGQLAGSSRRNFKANLGTKGVSLERID